MTGNVGNIVCSQNMTADVVLWGKYKRLQPHSGICLNKQQQQQQQPTTNNQQPQPQQQPTVNQEKHM